MELLAGLTVAQGSMFASFSAALLMVLGVLVSLRYRLSVGIAIIFLTSIIFALAMIRDAGIPLILGGLLGIVALLMDKNLV